MNKKVIDWWIGGGGVSYTTEYQAVLDRATALGYTLPSSAYKTKGDTLVSGLKSNSQWSLLNFLYVLYCDQDNFTLINWKSPSDAVLTKNSTVNFVANGGWLGGASGDLQGASADSFFGAGVRNVTCGVFFRWNSVTGCPLGFSGPKFSTTFTSQTATNVFSWSGTSDTVTGFDLGTAGVSQIRHFALRRVSSTVTPYLGGVALTDIARAVNTGDGSLRICSRGGGNYFNEQVRIVYGGSNSLDVSVMDTLINAYLS